jgi:hypothetical protein
MMAASDRDGEGFDPLGSANLATITIALLLILFVPLENDPMSANHRAEIADTGKVMELQQDDLHSTGLPVKRLRKQFRIRLKVHNFVKLKIIVLRKFFPRDKNYVLEQAQLSLEHSLLHYLVDYARVEYLLRHNPLGIEDEMAARIHAHTGTSYIHLHEFYITLTGIFRFTFYSDNQLLFDFDGRDPFEKYREEWTTQFRKWVKEFSKHNNFLRAVLDLTVFYPEDSPVVLMDTRMSTFLQNHFDIRIHPDKGIQRKHVA